MSAVKDRIVAIAVTDEALRLAFPPKYLGQRSVRFETDLYCWRSPLSPDYKGGFWNSFELSNAGFYMAPTRPTNDSRTCVHSRVTPTEFCGGQVPQTPRMCFSAR